MKRFLASGIAMAAILFSAGSFAEAQQGGQPSQGAQISQPGTSANQPSPSLKTEGKRARHPLPPNKVEPLTVKQNTPWYSKKKKQMRDVQRQFD